MTEDKTPIIKESILRRITSLEPEAAPEQGVTPGQGDFPGRDTPSGPEVLTEAERALCRSAAEQCLSAGLRRASRAAGRLYDAALRPAALRGTQFSLLVALELMGPSTLTALGGPLVLDRTTLTRNLRPLERRGLLKSVPGPDRRTRVLSLTPAGREALARALPLWESANAALAAALGEPLARSLRGDLDKTVSAARETCEVRET